MAGAIRTAGWGLGKVCVPADVGALSLVILIADVLAGIVVPTFSLHAQSLGVGLGLLGALNALTGIVQLCASVPLGILSDRVGRPILIVAGMACFGLGFLCFALAQGLPLLILGRLFFGLAPVATFQIGTAQLGDITTPGQRSFAFGLYATAMGLGFTIGPLIGGQLAERAGTPAAYLVGAAIALVGVALTLRTVHPIGSIRTRATETRGLRGIAAILGRADIALVCLGNLLVTWTFAGAITTFFPLYGEALGLTAVTLGSFFALRAFVSALGRLPNALIVRAFGSRAVLFTALVVEAAIMFALGHVASPALLALLLACEGLAYGAYLVAGQAYIADQSTAENRGTATGLYGMAASLGGVAAPAVLGVLAARAGLPAVFTATAWLLIGGLLIVALATVVLGRQARAAA